jgi:transcriptional regulator GlxA family with amidase domain
LSFTRQKNIFARFCRKKSLPVEKRRYRLSLCNFCGAFLLFSPEQVDHRIQEILNRIENDISQQFVIGDLAMSVNLSTSRLQHLFKQELQTNIVKYINNLRLEKARELLETSHFHVKEIRMRIGVTNESHFQRDFKQKFGASPNNYRNIFRNSRIGQLLAESDS